MWVIPALMAANGVRQGLNNQEKMKKQDQYRKAVIANSPWTQMQDPGGLQLPDAIQGGVSGAATGAMLAYGKGGLGEQLGGGTSNSSPNAGTYTAMSQGGPNYLGANQMSNELGQMGQNVQGYSKAIGGSASNDAMSREFLNAQTPGLQMPQVGASYKMRGSPGSLGGPWTQAANQSNGYGGF